jgi:hypothetical protein
VDHGPTRTTYEPVTGTARVGTRVDAGDRIGTLESFGSHCWPRSCLHWGLVAGSTYLDPLTLVGNRPVRLLPLDTALAAPGPALWRAPPGAPSALGRPPEVLAPRPVTVPWLSPGPTKGRSSAGDRNVVPWAPPPVGPWSAPPAGSWRAPVG